MNTRPTPAFVGASYFALAVGMVAFLIGIWNSSMLLNEKGLYFTLLMYALFSGVSIQKSVRDRSEGIQVTNVYYGICWFSIILCVVLLSISLWNASFTLSEKGFYGMAFLLSLFAAIAVQKNTRDVTTTFDRIKNR